PRARRPARAEALAAHQGLGSALSTQGTRRLAGARPRPRPAARPGTGAYPGFAAPPRQGSGQRRGPAFAFRRGRSPPRLPVPALLRPGARAEGDHPTAAEPVARPAVPGGLLRRGVGTGLGAALTD